MLRFSWTVLRLTCSRTDPKLRPCCREIWTTASRVLSEAGHPLQYVIRRRRLSFVAASRGLSGKAAFRRGTFAAECDGVIMNPPYFKVRKDSEHARLMRSIVHGQPNIYAFFMALAANLLKRNGETGGRLRPRSFCNGPYFRGFRRWYFDRVALDHVHIFRVANGDVQTLQRSRKRASSPKFTGWECASPTITVTTSFGGDMAGGMERAEMPAGDIIDNSSGDYVIRIPEGEDDREIMQPGRIVSAVLCRRWAARLDRPRRAVSGDRAPAG